MYSCAPTINTEIYKDVSQEKSSNQYIYTYSINEKINIKHEIIGSIKVGDSGFSTDFNFSTVLGLAKMLNLSANLPMVTGAKKEVILGEKL